MFRLGTIRRRLLLGAGSMLVLAGLSLCVVHTQLVRRFALVRIQSLLGNTQGLVLQATDLDYNLFQSRYELKNVSLRGVRLADMPAPLEAKRIVVLIPFWDLIHGSFQAARVQVDGLSLRSVTDRNGRTNLPPLGGSGGGGGQPAGPAVIVTNGQLYLQDDRNGLVLDLRGAQISTGWSTAQKAYSIALQTSAGRLQWNALRLPLELVRVKSSITGAGISLETLRVVSGDTLIEASGALSGSPARLDASASLNLDSRMVMEALAAKIPLKGALEARVTASGPLDALLLSAALRSPLLTIDKIRLNRPEIAARFDTKTGEVQVRELSAGLFSGQARVRGSLWTGAKKGRSELTADVLGIDAAQAAAAFGAEGIPSRRAAIQLRASCPGLDWRASQASGTLQVAPATVAFRAALNKNTIHTTLDTSLGLQGDVGINLANRSLTGALGGTVTSVAALGGQLEQILDRPAGSLLPGGLDGTARWNASLGGTLAAPTATVGLEANGISVGGLSGAEAQLETRYAPGQIQVDRAQINWQGQQVTAKGEIGGTEADSPLNLTAAVVSPSIAPVLKQLGIAAPIEGDLAGDVRLTGTIGQPVVDAAFHAGTLSAYGERFSRADIQARWQEGTLTVSRLLAEQDHASGDPGRLDVSGSLDIGSSRYAAHVSAKNLIPPPGPVTGNFDLAASGEGTLSDPVFQAEVAGTDVRAGEFEFGEVKAAVDSSAHRANVQVGIPALNAQASATLAMEKAWPFEFKLETRDTSLRTPTAASFDASVQANGSLAEPRVEYATANIRNLRLPIGGQEIAGDGPVELSYADGRIRVGRLALKTGESTVQVTGEIPADETGAPGSVAVAGTVHLDSLPQFLPGLAGTVIGGTAELNATLTGTAARLDPEGSITLRAAGFRGQPLPFPIEDLGGHLTIGKGLVTLNEVAGKAGTGTLRLDGSVPLRLLADIFPAAAGNPDQPARLSARLENIQFLGGSAQQPVTTTVGVNITGEASALTLPSVRAGIEFTELSVKTKDTELGQNTPTRLAIAGSTARLENLDLKGTTSTFHGSGSVGLTGDFPAQLQLAGQTNLSALAALVPAVEAAGTVRMDVRLEGSLSAPQTTGFLELDQASLAITDPRIQGANIKLRADLEGDRVTLKNFSGTINGGAFTGGGDLKLGAGGIRDANLFLKAKDVFEEYPAALKTTSSLDVKLVSRKNQLVLEGQIEVQEGFYESPFEAFSRTPAGLDSIAPASVETGGAPSKSPVGLDLKIVTRRPVEMDNNLGVISSTADLRLAGDFKHVRLLGTLALEQDGKLYFGDRTYYIEKGAVRFLDAPQVTPELDIHAYTITNDYTIKLGLTGVLSEVTTTFTSDPPLSRDDVISVLLTGKTVADNKGVDVRTLEAFSVATGAMNAALSNRLHHTLGVSRVSIQPSAIAAESNPGTRVTITQDFTRTLHLLYSMNLNDSADQIWIGQYDLTRSLTTRLVKQSDNTYRGEFRHDVRFGKSTAPPSLALQSGKRKVSAVEFTGGERFPREKLAKTFKVKPGQKYNAVKVRKGSDRLSGLFLKNGYLESRVRLDREDAPTGVSLNVRIDLGPVVEMAFRGADLPRGQKANLRQVWHSGISDQQRPQAARDAILDYFARKGYLRAQVAPHLSTKGDRKTVRFDVKPGIHYKDVKVVIQGAAPNRTREIRDLIGKRRLDISADRNPLQLNDAIVRYYQQRGYLAASVAPVVYDLDEDGRSGRIVIPIAEGPLFHVGAVQFNGNQALTQESLAGGLPIETGQVFEPARLDPAVAAIRVKYGNLGFRNPHIEYALARQNERALVDVTFAVVENKQTSIRSIKITGTRQTSVKFAQGRLRIAEGQIADTSRIRESAANLSLTGAYGATDIQLEVPPEPSIVPKDPPSVDGLDGVTAAKNTEDADVTVALTEPKPFRLLYGGLYDSGSGPGFIFDFQNHNTLGPGRTLGLRARYDSDTKEARIYLTQPFLGFKRLTTTLSTYYIHTIENGQDFPTEKAGVSVQQDYPVRAKFLLSWGIRFERQRAWLIQDGVAVPSRVVSETPLSFTVSRDVRDSFLDATRGSFTSHAFEFAPAALGSEYPYARYYLQYFKYFPLTRPRPVPYGETPNRSRLVFATGTRIGLQKGLHSDDLVLTDRFYAGGGTTVRGFQQDALGPTLANGSPIGGNAVIILNEELRYPLFWVFDAVSFVDVGNVFPHVTDVRLSDLRKAGGFGLRIRNPFVVLRLDYGFKLDRRPGEKIGAFFFSIGQAF